MMDYLWSFIFIGNIAAIAGNLLIIQSDLSGHRRVRGWLSPWLFLIGHSALAGIAAIELGIW